ncbi:NitT/TauT family transport system ATP-binding protein [Celeribacter baekdonensis]|uniref:NitT/TauT family transport system ATP-binding protein n=2 Tax=Celeribacter baekdonensis TaxID=875171 RepID=A0A1G7GMR9_9RHOB|nr:NitT/TauT family transport system ATP-binding protein [Celeribacter baekdonensis]
MNVMTITAPNAPAPARPQASPSGGVHVDLRSAHAGGVHILGPISFSIAPGASLALVGPSGVGKSTLLRVICGLHSDYDGTCERPERISTVFQEPTLLPWRSALDNLTLTTRIDASNARQWLTQVGLSDHADLFPGQLSLGQQRRLALARAFAAAPDLLLMDEAFVSLDPRLADEMMRLFETLRAHHVTTTILVTHDPKEAARLSDRVLILGGRPAQVQTAERA